MANKIFVYVLILVAVVALIFTFFRPSSESSSRQSLTTFLSDAKAGNIRLVEVSGNQMTVTRTNGASYVSLKEEGVSIVYSA